MQVDEVQQGRNLLKFAAVSHPRNCFVPSAQGLCNSPCSVHSGFKER